ncbi:hypothetical protein AB1Y20_003001 [Prymnesium parvum]|uniref:CS domain-containing protein n=1 Tax=Prymnesium parvum TaxID=97485 RepID=A0AB34JA69_PRYPA
MLRNGGQGDGYRWGQTLEEVTVHVAVEEGVRAKALDIAIRRRHLRIALKGGRVLLEGSLQQPILCDQSSWMLEPGVLVVVLAKDNMRAENLAGPSSEWWHGLFEAEDTLDKGEVSVEDYVKPEQLPPEQRRQAEEGHREQVAAAKAEAEYSVARQKARETEEGLPAAQRELLSSLRAKFPDFPIEWGDSSDLYPTE